VETPQTHRAAELARTLRAAGVRVVLDVSERRLDRKLRNADRLGARVAVIVGEEEMRGDDAVVRDLAERSQQRVPSAELAATVARLLETPA
jgi:histidyl-tRNA synthetase